MSPSGSRRRAMPRCCSAVLNACSRFALLELFGTCFMSTSSGRMLWMMALKATPSRQLRPKSFTSTPKRLQNKRRVTQRPTKQLRFNARKVADNCRKITFSDKIADLFYSLQLLVVSLMTPWHGSMVEFVLLVEVEGCQDAK